MPTQIKNTPKRFTTWPGMKRVTCFDPRKDQFTGEWKPGFDEHCTVECVAFGHNHPKVQ